MLWSDSHVTFFCGVYVFCIPAGILGKNIVTAIRQPHSQSRKIKIVVVGAGIIGASIAYHLSRRNHISVTILERDEPCSGASGHSFAWLNAFRKEPNSYHHFNRLSMDIWHRFADELCADVGLHCGGMLRWENTEEGAMALRQRVKQLQARGYPCRLISVDEFRQLEPGISPGVVSAASLSEIDGHVEPHKVIDACLQRARERGAELHTQTPVTGLRLGKKDRTTHSVEAVNTPNGEILCDVLVIASGIATSELAAMASVRVPQEDSPGVVIRTDPRPPLLHSVSVLHTPASGKDESEIHLRQSEDGTVILGEGSQESLHRDDSQEHADALLRRAIGYLPALAGARAIPVPLGQRPMPTDGLPAIGFAKAVPNLYIAVMHSGVTLAPLVSELAALEIVDGARAEMLAPYRPERFRL